MSEVRVARFPAIGQEAERACLLIHTKQLGHHPVAGRDLVLELPGCQVVEIEVPPIVALRIAHLLALVPGGTCQFTLPWPDSYGVAARPPVRRAPRRWRLRQCAASPVCGRAKWKRRPAGWNPGSFPRPSNRSCRPTGWRGKQCHRKSVDRCASGGIGRRITFGVSTGKIARWMLAMYSSPGSGYFQGGMPHLDLRRVHLAHVALVLLGRWRSSLSPATTTGWGGRSSPLPRCRARRRNPSRRRW